MPRSPAIPTTASSKEAEMRAMFVAYLAVICVGLVYFLSTAAMHT